MDLPTPEPPSSSATRAQPGPAEPASSAARTSWIVAALCLTVTIGFWWHIQGELAELRSVQARLASDVASLREIPTVDVTGAPALGADDAVVTLIEFSDYECPFCLRHFTETMPRIEASFINAGLLRYVFRDFPIDQLHPGAQRAHEAARCADEQGRFWELHRQLFAAPGAHDDAMLEARAENAGLQLPAFRECLSSGRTADAVDASVASAFALGANGTPFFLLGVRDIASDRVDILQAISGAQPYAVFEQAIMAVAGRVR